MIMMMLMNIRRARRIAERIVAARAAIYPGVEQAYAPPWMAQQFAPTAAARFRVDPERVGPPVLRQADREWEQQKRLSKALRTHTALAQYVLPPIKTSSPFVLHLGDGA